MNPQNVITWYSNARKNATRDLSNQEASIRASFLATSALASNTPIPADVLEQVEKDAATLRMFDLRYAELVNAALINQCDIAFFNKVRWTNPEPPVFAPYETEENEDGTA